MATPKRATPTQTERTREPKTTASAAAGGLAPDRDGDVGDGQFCLVADQVTPAEAHALPPQPAAQVALDRNSIRIPLPLGGSVTLPPPQHLAWYAGVGALVVLEIVEWPIAAVLALGHLLADQHQSKVLSDFGEALEHG